MKDLREAGKQGSPVVCEENGYDVKTKPTFFTSDKKTVAVIFIFAKIMLQTFLSYGKGGLRAPLRFFCFINNRLLFFRRNVSQM